MKSMYHKYITEQKGYVSLKEWVKRDFAEIHTNYQEETRALLFPEERQRLVHSLHKIFSFMQLPHVNYKKLFLFTRKDTQNKYIDFV